MEQGKRQPILLSTAGAETNKIPFQDGGRYHIETSPLIHRANQ